MLLKLSEIQFDYDFFTAVMPNGGYLVLNKIDEDLKDNENNTLKLDWINIAVYLEDEVIKCTSVIGMSNEYMSINTEYKELEGKTLSSENMKYCTLELFE